MRRAVFIAFYFPLTGKLHSVVVGDDPSTPTAHYEPGCDRMDLTFQEFISCRTEGAYKGVPIPDHIKVEALIAAKLEYARWLASAQRTSQASVFAMGAA